MISRFDAVISDKLKMMGCGNSEYWNVGIEVTSV
jgi:hypothetical protein